MKKEINLKLEIDYDEENRNGMVKLLDGDDYKELSKEEQTLIVKYLLNILYTKNIFTLQDKYGEMTEEEFMKNTEILDEYNEMTLDYLYNILEYISNLITAADTLEDISDVNAPFLYYKLTYDEDIEEVVPMSVISPTMPFEYYKAIIEDMLPLLVIRRYMDDNEFNVSDVTDELMDKCYDLGSDFVRDIKNTLDDIEKFNFKL